MDMSSHQNLERAAWMAELRTTLTLSWPIVLTNVAQNALTTSDVILMGWLGPRDLAAGALGTNLYFAFMIFGIGLMSAVSPLVAEELGRRRHSVRDVRRTVRQGLWSAVAITVPIWVIALEWGADPARHRPGTRPRRGGRRVHPRAAMESSAVPVLPRPALVHGGPGASALGLGDQPPCAPRERRRRLVPDARQVRPAAARPRRRRNRHHLVEHLHVPGPRRGRQRGSPHEAVPSVRPVLARRSGPASGPCGGSASRSG